MGKSFQVTQMEVLSVDEIMDPGISTVVAVDFQNDFCHPDGAQGRAGRDLHQIAQAVTTAAQFVGAARDRGVPTIHVGTIHSPETDSVSWLRRHRGRHTKSNCIDGTWGAEFFGLHPGESDIVIPKHRYSSFTGTELERVLRGTGRTSLFFVGVATRVCVESSLRDAVCRDFDATLVSDCCGDYTLAAHASALASVNSGFGECLRHDQVISEWDKRLNGRQPSGVERSRD